MSQFYIIPIVVSCRPDDLAGMTAEIERRLEPMFKDQVLTKAVSNKLNPEWLKAKLELHYPDAKMVGVAPRGAVTP